MCKSASFTLQPLVNEVMMPERTAYDLIAKTNPAFVQEILLLFHIENAQLDPFCQQTCRL